MDETIESIMKIFTPYLNTSELDAMSEATGEDWEQNLKDAIKQVIEGSTGVISINGG